MESMNRSAILRTLSPLAGCRDPWWRRRRTSCRRRHHCEWRASSELIRRRSVRRLVLRERLLELLHDGIRITAGLADIVGPLLLQRLGRLLPFAELGVGDGVNLMSRFGLHLGQAGVLEVRPWVGEFSRPFGGAMVVA